MNDRSSSPAAVPLAADHRHRQVPVVRDDARGDRRVRYEIVTVALRRIDLDAPGEAILDFLPEDVLLLPNTAGCETAEEAVRVARLARAAGLPTGSSSR